MDSTNIDPYDNIYKALADAEVGYIEAAAGCGKTEAIVLSVKKYCKGKQLILTHTNAGVNVLINRFKRHKVDTHKYHIDTIAGWALSWVQHYKITSQYKGDFPPKDNEWEDLYLSASKLLDKDFVRKTIQNSYKGVIIDEYQDCSKSIHVLIIALKNILSCRILGDNLQSIFNIGKNELVDWNKVISDLGPCLGKLEIPYRWKLKNQELGNVIIKMRNHTEKVYNNIAPIYTLSLKDYKYKIWDLIKTELDNKKAICFITANHKNMNDAYETTLLKSGKFKWLEPLSFPIVHNFVKGLETNKEYALLNLIEESYSSLNGQNINIEFLTDFLNYKIPVNNRLRNPKKMLLEKYRGGYSHLFLLELIEILNILVKKYKIALRKEYSIRLVQRIIKLHLETHENLPNIFLRELNRFKLNFKKPMRCLGSPLLIKGLEFDTVIIYNPYTDAWSLNDYYVALSRGSSKVIIINPQ